jgi:DNA-binding NarL/FixJ family response regulator
MTSDPKKNPIQVLLIDSHTIVLGALKLLLDAQERFVVCGTASNAAEALEQIERTEPGPDVIVLEIDLGRENGLDLIPRLMAKSKAKIVVLTGVKDLGLHDQAVILGARGVVKKDEATKTLFSAVEKIHLGEHWLNRSSTARILLEVARAHAPKESSVDEKKLATLTKKEEKVLQAVVASSGKQLKLVADEMHISGHTLRNHLAAIYDKLGVANRLELYVFCSDQARSK